ncbi:hypothetical protein IVB40_09695 [Bradyrhizobium sp. 40]|jgi:uncharacterized membrane protein|uniref:DUF2231 domain-containing protein n=1 Tax=unclassified Bradyrhizobium TaxID=2631580 RepID=UPI001FFADE75|nr:MULTISPECIES: DUF2231 domain-containing protein [unclassified Bradyrhizobium]MCK1405039.1 hypothetical protein [Bradyrhizobium sp. 76]UPJ44266.1 hypothetical protein IVB40_09695 [Bradyrhizobium sp. 40]
MSASVHAKAIHPLHAVLLAFPFPLFLGALFSDLAYWSTAQVQWANFSSWLIAGGLFAGAFVVLWALTTLGSGSRAVRYFLVLLAMWLTGFVNALVHAKDAWAIMPESLLLSAVATILSFAAAWIGYSGFSAGGLK